MSNNPTQIAVSDDLVLDLERKSLLRGQQELHLRPKSLEVLTVLAQNAGRVVSKNELIGLVWGNVAASDDSLAQCLIEIRKAMGDSDRTLIRTVPRQGYLLEPAPRTKPIAQGLLTPRRAAGLLVLFVVAMTLGWWQLRSPTGDVVAESSPAVATPPSIAVLPFVDMSESQDQGYLGEGFAEEILNLLVRSNDLRVVARTSSFAFRDEDIATVRDALNVTHVLEGSVRRVDDRLRITTQLIDADSSVHLWSNTYDKTVGDVFEIQSDIADSVATALEVALSLTTVSIQGDPYAHALVLQARALGHSLRPEAIPVAKELLEKALAIDPDNVRALTELSRIVFVSPDPETGAFRTERVWQEAMAIRERALAIDPQDVVANTYEAFSLMYYHHDFTAAARLFERVSAIDSTNLDVARNLQSASLIFGTWSVGAAVSSYLRDRDPFCVTCAWMSYNIYLRNGNYVEAKEAIEHLLLIRPESAPLHPFWRGQILLARNEPAEALEAFEQLDVELRERSFGLAIAYYLLGRREESTAAYSAFLDKILSEGHLEHRESYLVALLAAAIDRHDDAFEWLQKTRQAPPYQQGFQASYGDIFFRNLYDDPRWSDHLEAVGLSERQRALIDFSPTLPPTI
ncbi:MAG: winged helix-turn-helix domain-containing protein [Pseudomonadota bacterium]